MESVAMTITEKLAAALAFDERNYSSMIGEGYAKHELTRLAPLHAALIQAVDALEMGAFHHNACPWLSGKECCCANEKAKEALARLRECLGEE